MILLAVEPLSIHMCMW